MDKSKVPVPIFFDSPISTNSTIMVRGGDNYKKRWGLHVFEAYAADDTSRITMILNKHFEEGLPVAELYYYASAYGQGLNAYNWFRIGSDVPYHSFMFSRDRAIFYGQTEFRNLIRLDNIGAEDLSEENTDWKKSNEEAKKTVKRGDYPTEGTYRHAITAEGYKKESKYLKAQALKNAGDGTMFYDRDYNIIVAKVGGKWKKVPVEELPEGHPLRGAGRRQGSRRPTTPAGAITATVSGEPPKVGAGFSPVESGGDSGTANAPFRPCLRPSGSGISDSRKAELRRPRPNPTSRRGEFFATGRKTPRQCRANPPQSAPH